MLEYFLSLVLFVLPMGDLPSTSERTTVLMMLTTPMHIDVEDIIRGVPLSNISRVKEVLRIICIEEELLDERDVWILSEEQSFSYGLTIARERYFDLKDSPKVIESYYWVPDLEYCDKIISFNRACADYLKLKIVWELDRAPFYQIVLDETDDLYEKWYCLRILANKHSYVNEKRYYLQRYKNLVTKEEWEKKTIPESVPIWRFYELPAQKTP